MVDPSSVAVTRSMALLADGLEVLPDGGQRGVEIAGLGDVVEPDDADVVRDRAARLGERVQHADGHLVVGHEYRCRIASFAPARSPIS